MESKSTVTPVDDQSDIVKENKHLSDVFQEQYENYKPVENTEFSSLKAKKAAKFLLLPEIESLISDDEKKAEFLSSKGLNQQEITEAFSYYYKHRKSTSSKPNVPKSAVIKVYNNDANNQNQKNTNVNKSFFSSISNLLQKIFFYASITTTIYYTFQTWIRSEKHNKKEEKIENELSIIRAELNKLSIELRQNPFEKTKADLLNEINSLKAILVGRQYFEEKQNTKLNLPLWQLKQNASTVVEVHKEDEDSKTSALSSEKSEEKNLIENSEDKIEVRIED